MECVFVYPILRTAFLELTIIYYNIPVTFRQDYIWQEKEQNNLKNCYLYIIIVPKFLKLLKKTK